MASMAAQEAITRPSTSRSLSFVDLPREVQEEIVRHCSARDLVCVALVSKHFRDLAAAQLYREFVIVFPDEDNPQFDTPVDALAGGFDTFVTSDYNYAQYLRNLCFDTLYMGDKAEVAYRPYLANLSCGKFMNTLLLLTLRKARALESFKWNIRVELSRPVYNQLHQIEALSHVHIRLQSGPSQYEIPPPLPYSPVHTHSPPVPAHAAPVASIPPSTTFGLIPPPPTQGFYLPTSTVSLPPVSLPPLLKAGRLKASKRTPVTKEPPTLSGFKRLKSLAVLDIESLDIVPELQSCIRNSAGTLSKLKLSLSEKLASTARKPSVDPDLEDSDQDDELLPIPAASQSHAQNDEMSGPARAFRAQEERKAQESVLGRIFDVEPTQVERTHVVTTEKKKETGKAKSEQDVVDFMKTVATKLMGELNGTRDFAAPQEVLDMIGLAAQKYMDEAKLRKEREGQKAESSGASSSSAAPGSKGSQEGTDETLAELSDSAVSLFRESSTSNKAKEDQGDANPDDINIEEPEEQLAIDPEDPPSSEGTINEPISPSPEDPACTTTPLANAKAEYGKALATLEVQKAKYKALAGELEEFESQAHALARDIRRWRAANASVDSQSLAEAESRLASFTRSVRDMQKEIGACEAAIEYAETVPTDRRDLAKDQARARHMQDYLRDTRGIALESLSIYLIPVKASVLSRAVDLRVLRRLTLLNVGIQAPIWALLHRENKESPLPLRKIFTDNVSKVFLDFVSSLQEVHELFMLERETKARPESFAPRTQTTIDQIRKLALKKHLPTLRRLMIKNLADTSWDVDKKAVLALCRFGRKLEELACNMSIGAMHCLMQHVAGLASLRALHVVHLRNDDTCLSVMRETKRFLIDNVSHYPDLKLRWIAIDEDDRADELVRVADWPRREGHFFFFVVLIFFNRLCIYFLPRGGMNLGSLNLNLGSTSAEDVDVSALIAAAGLGPGGEDGGAALGGGASSESDEEDEDDGPDGSLGQKIETVEAIPFYEVPDVRIFKKEIVAGRL
ncbi:6319fc93-2b8f-4ed2-8a9a-e066f5ed8ccd [Thermothielavioides terrestris]|uniref:6319fc93-2b8f-4ed2-8a9a-e066f5ed8ccd n=1 Tax=Thermothielavioides terrestris TaxID=2587410 RepID=A0A3S5CXC1_9PEZI|nr:6319fc93-2b8f-4ed2-8a9a-e066f5ed8ccd [Thermothielavioides terrestris]